MKKILFVFAAVLTLSMMFAGCAAGGSPAQSGAQASAGSGALTAEDMAYAEPLVDNLLAGIKDRDYAVFSRDMTDLMKSAMTEDALGQLADFLSKIGEYQSRTFAQAANVTQNGVTYAVVIYTAKYSNEPGDVLITVTFTGDKKIEGLNFNSPKLREQ